MWSHGIQAIQGSARGKVLFIMCSYSKLTNSSDSLNCILSGNAKAPPEIWIKDRKKMHGGAQPAYCSRRCSDAYRRSLWPTKNPSEGLHFKPPFLTYA